MCERDRACVSCKSSFTGCLKNTSQGGGSFEFSVQFLLLKRLETPKMFFRLKKTLRVYPTKEFEKSFFQKWKQIFICG